MIVFRVHKSPNPAMVFSGDGGLYTAGRWNYKGQKVVYCSEHLSLATMEWLAHNGLSVSAFSYNRFSIEIPDSEVKQYDLSDLPQGWDNEPATDASRKFAHEYLFQDDGPLALAVPSVMIPEERNILINPLHKKYLKVQPTIQHLGKFKVPIR